MIATILKTFSKLLGGSQAEKALKEIEPIVAEINAYFASYSSLSNDDLRSKTDEFISRINHHLQSTDNEISDLKKQLIEADESNIELRDTIFQSLDALEKKRDIDLEEILKMLLPEAFAVVKETSRRFSENSELHATANDLDLLLSENCAHISVENG
ncbi:MAG: preprotein translocase subunit SecA, partial [Bacteroidetes bacterium]|nr:preprotein translocase subunit SecA [Bacteroidota bacterium]